MPWQDELRPASFRNVPFHTRSADVGGGKRGQLHEYPNRDIPYFEELGLRGEEFSLDAYVIGPEYMRSRDALLSALRKRGAGTLVHPYRGTVDVVATAWSIRESTEAGGMAVFSVTFVESGKNTFPNTTPRTGDILESAAQSASDAVSASFVQRFSTSDAVQWVVDDSADVVRSVAAVLEVAPEGLGGISGDLAGYARTVARLAIDAAELVADPSALAGRVIEAFAELGGLSVAGDSVLYAFETLSQFGAELLPIPESTPNRQRQAANRGRLVDLTRRAAAIEAARAGMIVPISSYSDALSVRERVLAVIDREAGAAGEIDDVDGYRALRALGLAVVADFRARGATLAESATVVPTQTIPVLVLANRYYGNVDRAEEIVSRNHIRHPGFVPGGRPVELLGATG